MNKAEFERVAPVMTEEEARHEAAVAILEVMGLKAEGDFSIGKARRVYLEHGLWVCPLKRRAPTLHFRDEAHDGSVRPLEPKRHYE